MILHYISSDRLNETTDADDELSFLCISHFNVCRTGHSEDTSGVLHVLRCVKSVATCCIRNTPDMNEIGFY